MLWKHVVLVLVAVSSASLVVTAFLSQPTTRRRSLSSSHSNNGKFYLKNNDDEDEKEESYHQKKEEEDEDRDEVNVGIPLSEDVLNDPTVKRKKNKKKKGHTQYKTIDNRDSLPFVIKDITPDPYTNIAKKKKDAIENTKQDRERNKAKSNKARRTLLGINQGIAASIYTEDDDGSLHKILGEFHLDKSTTSGDVIEFDGSEYLVQKARCQYKYAGGKKFFMCRKILEVKDVTRVEVESKLMKQLNGNDSSNETMSSFD